jgi:protein involved in polysaccharide export with SLBB domain
MIKVTPLKATWGTALGILLVGMFVAGCRTSSKDNVFAEVPGTTPAKAAPSGAATTPEAAPAAPATSGSGDADSSHLVLQPGDAITVVYNDLPTIVPPFEGEIKPDGTITLILNKNFKAAGKTIAELEKDIRAEYVPNYFKQMTVQVRAKDEKRLYYVGGEVRSPGRQMYLGRVTVVKAIQSAGDFTDFAKKTKVKLTRADGKQITVNCTKALEDPKYDVEVFPGDTIHVPRRYF